MVSLSEYILEIRKAAREDWALLPLLVTVLTGFSSLATIVRLQIVESHHLVKDGLYRHVRHPIYLGETLRNFGIVSVFSSVYGVLLMAVATGFLFFRIRTEERILTERFGEEYKEYQRTTKRIVPYTY